MRTVAFCEIDPYCQLVLSERWPGVEIHEDIATRGFVEGEADIITAGFPCQDVSFAGDGAGLAGDRSGLYRHVIRAIRLVRPKVAVLENVAALLNRGLDEIVGDLAEIGYDAEWHCIPACAVGAPHRRDRIWIVAIPFGDGQQGSSSGGETEREDGAQARGQAGGILIAPSITNAICREFAQRGQIGRMGRQESISWDGPWEITSEPFVRRGNHGISNWAHRLRTLGNAVVPQIPEIIGRAIMTAFTAQGRLDPAQVTAAIYTAPGLYLSPSDSEKAAIAAIESLSYQCSPWQLIETAPRDGSRILAVGGGLGDVVEIVSYNERVGGWDTPEHTLDDRDDEAEGYSRPTKWQHLPSTSAASTDGGAK